MFYNTRATIDADLESFLGLFAWEKHLTEAMRHQLALSRLVNNDDQSAAEFAFTYVRRVGMGELAEELEDAGNDPAARAEVRAFFEMACQPSWLASGPDDPEGP